MEASKVKRCPVCGETKAVSCFSVSVRGSLVSACKPCVVKRVADWRIRNPDKHAELRKRHNAVKVARRNRPRAVGLPKKEADRRYYERVKGTPGYAAKAAARIAKRRAIKKNAKVPWANEFFLQEAYLLAKLRTTVTGFPWEVDHIVPLQSGHVCGLHVEHNVQVIPASANKSKGNRTWPGMWEVL